MIFNRYFRTLASTNTLPTTTPTGSGRKTLDHSLSVCLVGVLLNLSIAGWSQAEQKAEQCEQRETMLKYLALEKTFDDWLAGCTRKKFAHLNGEHAATACNCIVERTMSAISLGVRDMPSGAEVCDSDIATFISADTKSTVTENCIEQTRNLGG